jgi:hypothetical protein
MSTTIAKPEDFRRTVERSNAELVVLPASGLSVLLCRPPVFAALAMGREGTLLQARVTDAKPEEIKTEDIEAFTSWLTATLTRLFVEPRFAADPAADEVGLADILLEDLKFIFRWLRGEVFGTANIGQGTVDSGTSVNCQPSTVNCTEDLSRFPARQRAAAVPGGGGEAQFVPPQPVVGAHRHAGVPAGLHSG